MKKTSRRGHSTMNELNITPLLDLVFVLLVIFIITTPQMINSLTMNLPPGTPPKANTNKPPKVNRIVVDAKAQVFLNNDFVPDTSLLATFQGLRTTEDPDPKVVVKGEDEVEYQGMIKVLDALQQAQIDKVGLATAQ
jgi:biopolymer transport protein ExbD